jgi:hypothetical protein
MKGKSREKKGQFYLIATLLVAIICVGAVITTYSIIRTSPFQNPPNVLNAIEEMNLAIKRTLEFTAGYYGSILQVTGNSTYAEALAENYLQSGFANLAKIHPDWNPSFDLKYSNISTSWFSQSSYTIGNIYVTYNISGLGIFGINYATSSTLQVDVAHFTNPGQAQVRVTREENVSDLTLGINNFFFYSYNYNRSEWTLVPPASNPTAFSNGIYILGIPAGVSSDAYMIQVVDTRGMMTTVSISSQIAYTFSWDQNYKGLTKDTIAVEVLQNGTLRWLGQNLQLSTNGKPIPQLPVKALHINQTINGIIREVPFQVEDWGSNYEVPLGLTSNASLFGNRQMIVFLVNHNVSGVTLWWNGQDTAKQTPYAFTNRYFTGDVLPTPPSNPGKLTNGRLTLTISYSGFTLTSSIAGGNITTAPSFLRINNKQPTYGSSTAYVIHHGIVRDIVQQEAEWSGGILKSASPPATEDCPNVYSQIYLTLPANATYYTYATRLVFINSSQSRTIKDLSAIQLSISGGSQRTENGTSGGYPISSNVAGLFYNFTSPSFQTGWAHHWSEFISGSSGAGIMFTDDANRKLYTFDSIAGQKTGALNVISSSKTIEFNPVARSQYPASFINKRDVTWHGAVVTFNNDVNNTIYPASGTTGLWVMVELPPKILVVTNNLPVTFTQYGLDFSASGTVITVNGVPKTYNNLPYTLWVGNGSSVTYSYAATVSSSISGKQFVSTGVTGPASPMTVYGPITVTGNYKTQYYLTMFTNLGTVSPASGWYDAGSIVTISATAPTAGTGEQYIWNGWTGSGSGSYTGTNNPATNAVTMNGPVTETASWTHKFQVTFQQSGLSSDATGTILTVGTNTYTYSQLPQTGIWVDDGTTYSYTSAVPAGTGKQYFLTGVTGGLALPIHSSGTATGNYKTQYYLTVTSPYGTPSPVSGWFDSGSSMTESVTSPVSGGSGVQYVCIGWSGAGSVPASGTASSVTFTIGAPSTITWNWQTQYYLTVNNGGQGTTSGQSWYNAGASATFSISPTTVSGGTGIQYVFNGWIGLGSGSYTGSSSSHSVTMNNPITETANWQTQYYLTVSSAYGTTSGQGWYNSSATAYAGLNSGTVSGGAGIQYVFISWSGDASGTNYAQSNGITINAPKTATANWQTQYQVTFNYQVSGGGSGYSAPSVTYTSLGSQHSVTANSTTVWADSGSTYTYTNNPLAGSGASQRWYASTGTSGTISSSTTINPTYYHQYYLANNLITGSVNSITASPTGDSWYNSGSSVNIVLNYVWSVVASQSRSNLFSYTVDGSTTNVARSGTGTYSLPAIFMTASHVVSDASKTQYYLTVTGGNGVSYGTASPTGDNWYDNGQSTTVSSNWVWNTISGQSRTAITNWQLDGNNQNPARQGLGTLTTYLVSMTTYHTVNFVSTTQYYLTVSGGNSISYGTASPTSDNWYDSGHSTTVSSYWVWNTVSGQSRTAITNWQLDGSNQNPSRQGTGTLTTSSISMMTYHAVNFVSTTQYYLTISGGNGVSAGGSQTNDQWFDSGTSATATSNYVWSSVSGQSRNNLYRYNLDGGSWNSIARANTGTYTTPSITMSTYHTLNFDYRVQYYLTVSGGNSIAYGTSSPTSDNWYDSGTSTTVSSNWVWNTVSGHSRTAITNWQLDGANQNPSRQGSGTLTTSSITMSTYHTVNFISITQYYLTVTGGNSITYGTASPTGDNWYDSGTSTTVSSNWVWNTIAGQSQIAISNYAIDGVNQNPARQGSGTLTTPSISMNTYHTVAFASVTQYYVTFDASSNVKGDSSATIVTVAGTGKTGSQLPYATWYDSGSSLSYSYASPIGSSSSSITGYYWSTTGGLGQTLQSNIFTVSAYGTVTATYTTRTFGIDTSCIGFGSESSSGSIPIITSSMTAQANELIIVVVTSGHSGSSSTRTFTITDSFGDTYTQRGSTVTSGSNAEQISEYYANTGSHTGSFTVTATDSSGSYNRNIDVLAFGITGAAASPFDTHAGLPYPAHNGGSSAPTVTGVSTSNAHDMILAFEGHLSSTADTVGTLAGTAFSAPSGFLNNPSNGEGCNAEYQIVSSAISSATATFGTSESNWVMIVDAVQRAW